jgi:predicted RNase H-like HicB family nuclease
MSTPNDPIELTVVYEDAAAGRLTATIPALPGTISWGRTEAEARGNVVDALRNLLRSSPRTFPTTQPRSACVSPWPSHGARRAIWDSTASSGTGRTRSSHGSIRP